MIINITNEMLTDMLAFQASETDLTSNIVRSFTLLIQNGYKLDDSIISNVFLYVKKIKSYLEEQNIKYTYTKLPSGLLFYLDKNNKIQSDALVTREYILDSNKSIDENIFEIFKNKDDDKNSCIVLYLISCKITDNKPTYFIRYAHMKIEDNETFILPQNLYDGSIQIQLKEMDIMELLNNIEAQKNESDTSNN